MERCDKCGWVFEGRTCPQCSEDREEAVADKASIISFRYRDGGGFLVDSLSIYRDEEYLGHIRFETYGGFTVYIGDELMMRKELLEQAIWSVASGVLSPA